MRPTAHFYFRSSVLSLCLLAASYPLSAAEVYKWVDKDGNTVYSSTPPPGETKASTVRTPSTPAGAEATRKTMQAEIKRANAFLEDRQKQADEEQKAKDDLAFEQENCRRARTRQQSYSIPRGRIVQEDGTQVRPDEETRLKKLAEASKEVEKWCK